MSLCTECKNKTCLTTGKPCKEVEKILKKETTGRRNWLSYIEKPSGVPTLDKVLIEGINKKGKPEAFYVSRGKRKLSHPINE